MLPDKIPYSSLVDLIFEGESMTGLHFQQNIVDSLYAINYDSLAEIGLLEF